MKMSRKWARISILSICLGIVLLIIPVFLESLFPFYIGIGLIMFALIIKFFVLRCPNCGWGGAVPQWTKSGTIHCPKCGKAVEYDD
ncbi:MAG: hypothetical protein PHE70_01785 [Tepidanaerobacteraceae bacterium]|nr:hypothetical protein [Tepidanaerobacteraceae bacterium]